MRPGQLNENSQHKRTHTRGFGCQTCLRRFATPSDLRRHSTVHRVGHELFSCNVTTCSFTAIRKDTLLRHVQRHHPANEQKDLVKGTKAVVKTAQPTNEDDSVLDASGGPEYSNQPPGWTVMMAAARTGDTQRLTYLLQRGMSVNAVAADGYTALHCAARAGQVLSK
jgi:hypothetical protein